MADIFISYSQVDKDIARGIATFLADCGYDIWWDYELVGGVTFRDKIKQEVKAAKIAVVIWSATSVVSDWVIDEADEARAARKLIALRVPELPFGDIPLGFRGVQTDQTTEPDRLLKALEEKGVMPSREPKAPTMARVSLGGAVDPQTIAKAEQFAHWEFIKASTDPADFIRFLEMFPEGYFSMLARAKVAQFAKAAWEPLKTSEDVAALRAFVAQYPTAVARPDAEARIAILEEAGRARQAQAVADAIAADWRRVQTSDQVAEFEAFAARTEQALKDAAALGKPIAPTYLPEALRRIEALRAREATVAPERAAWEPLRGSHDPYAVLAYLVQHPNGACDGEALERLKAMPEEWEEAAWRLVVDSRSRAAVEAYLLMFPKSRHAAELRKRKSEGGKTLAGTTTRTRREASVAPKMALVDTLVPGKATTSKAVLDDREVTGALVAGFFHKTLDYQYPHAVFFWMGVGLSVILSALFYLHVGESLSV